MSGNYQSPYGFGPVTDAMLDAVAERHGLTPDELADKITPEFTDWVESEGWDTVMGPAVDEFDNRLFTEDSDAAGD